MRFFLIFLFHSYLDNLSAIIKYSKSKKSIINSNVLPGNLLPSFFFMQGKVEGGQTVNIGGGRGSAKPFIPDDSCDSDIFQDASPDLRSPQLPYLTQDMWTCERKQENVDVWIYENEYLRVSINPQYGGKISGIYDVKRQRDLIFDNKVHQPANIGALHAWASGGAEWNWSPGIIGHSAFTESDVYLAEINTDLGPMMRVYEFDRYNSTVWQVDILLVDDTLFVHPRITNPTDCDLRGYWWTCVAVPVKEKTRVFSPAHYVVETSRLTAAKSPWPYFAEAIENGSFIGMNNQWPTDNSWLSNHPSSGDLFLRIMDDVYTPFIGHSDGDDFVYIHGHPLNGTKFFSWGNSGPGRFMQDFLSGGIYRGGDYTELQVGPAPTQMQTFSLPKNSKLEWTEWFIGFNADPNLLQGNNYSSAIEHIETLLKKYVPRENVDNIDQFFESYSSHAPDIILSQGKSWGALEELKNNAKLFDGLNFTFPNVKDFHYHEILPWLELLQNGTFSNTTLGKLPLSYQTTDSWRDLIEASSLREPGMTWLHALHLGVCSAERGNRDEPQTYFSMSFDLLPNPIAARCLAVLCTSTTDAWSYYLKAYSTLEAFRSDSAFDRISANLVNEMAVFLLQTSWYDDIQSFLENVYSQYYWIDAVSRLQVVYFNHLKQYDLSMDILSSNCFPTYASDRSTLMTLWNQAVEGKAQAVSEKDKYLARKNNPIPRNIGCNKGSKYCLNYW